MAVLDLVHISHRYTKGGAFGGRQSNQVLFDVSLSLDAGSTVALVGESGCGKTTLGKIAADVVRPSEGSVCFEGRDVQFIHQEPYASLNPTRTVADTLTAPLRRHKIARNKREALSKVDELL